MGDGRELSRSIPSVRAVDEDVRRVDVDVSDDDVGSLEDRSCVLEPAGPTKSLTIQRKSNDPRRRRSRSSASSHRFRVSQRFHHSRERVPHHMDVLDPQVSLLPSLVVLHVLRSSSFRDVGHRVGRRSSVDDEVRAGRSVDVRMMSGTRRVESGSVGSGGSKVGLEDGFDELLILNGSRVLEADHGLTGTSDGRLNEVKRYREWSSALVREKDEVLPSIRERETDVVGPVKIGESRNPLLASVLGCVVENRVADLGWYDEFRRVGRRVLKG